jgi:hypothetical protein
MWAICPFLIFDLYEVSEYLFFVERRKTKQREGVAMWQWGGIKGGEWEKPLPCGEGGGMDMGRHFPINPSFMGQSYRVTMSTDALAPVFLFPHKKVTFAMR